jgi:hypothetical protein
MLRELSFKTWTVMCLGLVLGLSLGGAVAVGVLLGQRDPGSARLQAFEELKLKASATHGSDTFAIATGHIDEEIEGLFTLDFVTGDLQCFVLNSRTGAMAGRFMINVNDAKIFGAKRGKKPNFLMTTGAFNGGASSGGAKPLPASTWAGRLPERVTTGRPIARDQGSRRRPAGHRGTSACWRPVHPAPE